MEEGRREEEEGREERWEVEEREGEQRGRHGAREGGGRLGRRHFKNKLRWRLSQLTDGSKSTVVHCAEGDVYTHDALSLFHHPEHHLPRRLTHVVEHRVKGHHYPYGKFKRSLATASGYRLALFH